MGKEWVKKKIIIIRRSLRGKFPVVITSDETKLDNMMYYTKLTWNNLAYNSDGFMTSVYEFLLIRLIKTQNIQWPLVSWRLK